MKERDCDLHQKSGKKNPANSQSCHFHGDSSSSQSEFPCNCVLKFPNKFPKLGMNLSIRLESQILFGCGMFTSLELEVPSPLCPASSPPKSS